MTDIVLPAILAVAVWAAPQPQYSQGLLVVYGGQSLVQANAHWHGYTLAPTDGCGLASISPAHLGQLAWVRRPGGSWQGPCLVVDVVARKDAYGSIYLRREVAEVSRATAAALGFDHGGRWGEIYFGACPPDVRSRQTAEPYRPRIAWDWAPYDWTPSFYPYPSQQLPAACGAPMSADMEPYVQPYA